jgi:uncharacterized protein (TIGR03083 family)
MVAGWSIRGMAGIYEHVSALRSDLDRFTALIASEPSAASLAKPVPGLTWTAGEVISHVTAVLTAMAATLRGEALPFADAIEDLPATGTVPVNQIVAIANERGVEAYKPVDVDSAAVMISEAGKELIEAVSQAADPSRVCPTPWYGIGATRTAGTLAAVTHGELLMHGLDLARALGRPWELPRASAAPVAYALLSGMAPYMVTDAGRALTATFALSIRGGERIVVRFANGAMTTEALVGRVHADCRMSMDPAAVLMTGYGRASQWPYIARGQLLAYGREPWLAMKFLGCLHRP